MSSPIAATSPSTPIRVALLGIGGAGKLAGALADGLLQSKYRGQVDLTVISRPIAADAPEAKRAAVTSLTERGAKIIHASASQGADALSQILRGFDVVLSSLGTPAKQDQHVFVEAARIAGVPWFIQSTFGFDITQKGSHVGAAFADDKLDVIAALQSGGIDWTVFNTGAFAEYALSPVFGVDTKTKTIVFPGSGDVEMTHTAMADVGVIVADAIVTGRGRNQRLYTSSGNFTYEEYAQLLEKATGAKWSRLVRTKAESLAGATTQPFPQKFFSLFELQIGERDGSVSWPRDQTYNVKYGIPTTDVESLVTKALNEDHEDMLRLRDRLLPQSRPAEKQ